MFEKQIDFFYGDNNSEVLSLFHPGTLEKRASMSQELVEFIESLKALNGKTYALVNALSAGEYFGPNRNGDYFPEDSLKQYHKTFEALGHVYKHHVNKDPNIALGKVLYSHYNNMMHRVELVLELDDKRASDVINKLNSGYLPSVSMGCKVPWDECSICHNRAKNRNEYCEHLLKQMNKVLPDGRKVYAKNLRPKFFDISIVLIPAEKTAGFLKVINGSLPESTNYHKKLAFYNSNSYIKLAELDNVAEIKKEVTSNDADIAVSKNPKQLVNLVRHAQNKIDNDVLCKLSEFPLNETLSTMLVLRILPTKEDFQKLALYYLGNNELADELESNKIVFQIKETNTIPNDIKFDNFNTKVAELLLPNVPKLSLTKELVISRELEKIAQVWQEPQPPVERSFISRALFGSSPNPPLSPVKNPILPLGILGTLYYGYTKVFNKKSTSEFRKFMLNNPWLLPVLVGSVSLGTVLAQDNTFNKTASIGVDKFMRNSLISFPLAYYMSGKYENDAQKGKLISKTQNIVRKHPALTAILGSLVAVKGEKMLNKVANFISQLPEKKVDELYIDIIN